MARTAPPRPAQGPRTVVGYVRVSTDEQGDSGAGLEAQRQAIEAACRVRGWELAAIHQDVASGKSVNGRPGLDAALAALRRHEVDGLVVAKLDRLSRSVIDAATTIEGAQREGWTLVLLDVGVDLSTAHGEAMANMTATFAQLERRLIGERTRAALAVKRAQGVRLGRPRSLPVEVVERIAAERAAGATLQAIADQLNVEGVATGRGGSQWRRCTVAKVLESLRHDEFAAASTAA
jgi:DNA invertase Pin-like site-specific DNA recombinase